MLATANRESRAIRSPHISSEHFLLGAVAYGRGIGAAIIANAGLQADALRAHLAKVGWTREEVSHGYGVSTRPVFIASVRHADALGHPEIEPEHIILGLLDEQAGGGAASVFAHFRVDVPGTRRAIIESISHGPDNTPAA